MDSSYANETFYFEFEHDPEIWHIRSARVKQGHTFKTAEMQMKVNPISCYSGTM